MLRTTQTEASAESAAEDGPLTPTQDLILEVLGARHRTGEHLWTFDAKLSSSLSRLEKRGLIRGMHGSVPNTLRASLTTKGLARAISATYLTPIEQDLMAARTEIKVLRQAIVRGAGS